MAIVKTISPKIVSQNHLSESLAYIVKDEKASDCYYHNCINDYDIEMISDDRNNSITFRGNGFMRYMIRFIVGTAIEVARNKVELSDVKKALDETEKRNIVSWKAPASGLILVKVNY